jgi:hypothetical protein
MVAWRCRRGRLRAYRRGLLPPVGAARAAEIKDGQARALEADREGPLMIVAGPVLDASAMERTDGNTGVVLGDHTKAQAVRIP